MDYWGWKDLYGQQMAEVHFKQNELPYHKCDNKCALCCTSLPEVKGECAVDDCDEDVFEMKEGGAKHYYMCFDHTSDGLKNGVCDSCQLPLSEIGKCLHRRRDVEEQRKAVDVEEDDNDDEE
jgi:hypothetical protein